MITRVTDYFNRYKTPSERLMAAQSMLRASNYGRGNVIRAELDGDNVVFISSVTGKVHTSLDAAIKEVQPLQLTQVTSVSAARARSMGRRGGRSFAGNKTSAAAAMFSSVISQLQSAVNSADLQLLRDAGIDVDELIKNGNMDILTMHARKGESSVKQIAERIRVMRERGSLHGLTVVDDEGGRVVQFRAGKNLLNSYQTNLLLSVTGHDMLDPNKFQDILIGGKTDKLAEALMKIPKRAKAFLAEREVSLAGGELSRFIGKHAKNLNDAFLYIDPQFDLLKKFADQKLTQDLNVVYAKADPTEFLDQYLQKMSTSDIDTLKKNIRNAISSGVKNSDQLYKFLQDRYKSSPSSLKLIEQMFDTIEYGFDGSDTLNSKHLRNYRKSLQSERDRLNGRVASLTGDAKKQAMEQISEIDQQLKSIDLGLRHGDQITGRGRVAGRGDIKTAFHITNLDPRLNKYAGIISKFSLKGELGLMGEQESLILGGFGDLRDDILQGRSRGLVYADPVLTAFQPEYFADLETQKAIQGRIDSVVSEFQSAIDNNVLPQKLKSMLERSASEDVDMLPPHLRYSAFRNREFARQILELHRSGVSPRQSPKMMNLLASMMASQAFREKDGFIQAVLPDVYRFAIDTEAIAYGSKNINPILGTGYEKIGGIRDTVRNQVVKIDKDLIKFRVKGHKMMFAPGVVGNVRDALGGFDLDDKGLPKLTTFTDDKGVRRLGFNIFRQPSGPEEVIFGRMSMDFETIQALFSGDQFTQALDELVEENAVISDTNRFNTLKFILEAKDPSFKDKLISESPDIKSAYKIPPTGYPTKSIPQIEDDVEEAILAVYHRLEAKGLTRVSDLSKKSRVLERIGKFGSASLTLEDVTQEGGATYTRQGIHKIMSKSGSFSMADEMMQVLEENKSQIKNSTYRKMKSIIQSSGGDFSLVMKDLSHFFPDDPSARAIFSMAFQESARAAQEAGADILGVYVNRSMAVGSFINQYEDILDNLRINNQQAGKFILENFQIGLLAQESAIDLSVNFSASRQLNAAIGDAIYRSGFTLNVKGVEAAVNTITGQMGSLNDIGTKAISSLGKVIGAVGTLDEVSDIGAGLDSLLLNSRLQDQDLRTLLEGMLAGAEEMQKAGLATADATMVSDRIEKMRTLVVERDKEKIRDYLLETIGLVRGNKYASLANVDAKAGLDMFEAIRKSAIGRVGRDQTLSGIVVNSETQAAAKAIMDRHADLIEGIYDRFNASITSLAEEEIMESKGALEYYGRQVLDDIAEAVRFKDVSMMDLVNEIDRLSEGRRFDLGMMRAVFDDSEIGNAFELSKRIMDIRNIRRADYYSRMDDLAGGLGLDIESILKDMLGGDFSVDDLDKQAREMLDTLRLGTFELRVEEVLMSLSGESEDITDRAARAEADRIATLIRSRIAVQALEDSSPGVVDELRAAGVMDDLSQEADDSIFRDIVKIIDDEAAGSSEVKDAVYKRFTDKLKENDFRRFLKSAPIKNTGIAIGALVLGSFAYSSYKDRTYEDAQGPPLLPGGSAYEQGYPFRVPEIGSFSGQGYNPGMNYQVSINGSQQDIDRFNSELGGLTNANINTTMYDRAPDLSRNPLLRIMEAF